MSMKRTTVQSRRRCRPNACWFTKFPRAGNRFAISSACLFLPIPSRAPIRPPSSERGSDGTTTRIDLAQPHSVRYSGRIRIGVWMAMDIKGALNRLADGKDLTGTEMRDVMEIIMEGGATASQIGAFLMGMRVKGETVGE